MREVARLGVLSRDSRVFPHCWMPTRRVRNLMQSLGCTGLAGSGRSEDGARIIGDFVRTGMNGTDPTFGDCYDLPLQIITRSRHGEELRDMLGMSDLSFLDTDDAG